MDDFHSSISFDMRLYRQDITGSIAHSAALVECGVITEEEYSRIKMRIEGILKDIENGIIRFDTGYEDIHMNIEKLLTDRIGEAGKKLHTTRAETTRWRWTSKCTSKSSHTAPANWSPENTGGPSEQTSIP